MKFYAKYPKTYANFALTSLNSCCDAELGPPFERSADFDVT